MWEIPGEGAEEVSCLIVEFAVKLSGKRAVSGHNSEKPIEKIGTEGAIFF